MRMLGLRGRYAPSALLALLFVAGCAVDTTTNRPTLDPDATAPPAPTAVVIVRAPSPTPQPSTPTPSPTATSVPTPTATPSPEPSPRPAPSNTLTVSTSSVADVGPPGMGPGIGMGRVIVIGGDMFATELALTPAERTKGLSMRDSLDPGSGMLFMSSMGVAPTIWMKGMRFSLDLVWISQDCVVAQIDADVPAPPKDIADSELPRYSTDSPAAHVLEINAGEAAEYGLAEGDRVQFQGMALETGAVCQ